MKKRDEFEDLDLTEPGSANEKMKEGLARSYADLGFRSYLENVIKIENHNALVHIEKGKNNEALLCTLKIKVYNDLLKKGKLLYTNFEGIKKNAQKEQEEEKEHARV